MAKPTCSTKLCRDVATIGGMCSYHFREKPPEVPPRPPRVTPRMGRVAQAPPTNAYRNYGLTSDEYRALWDSQSGKCAICERDFWTLYRDGPKSNIDHDHVTGRVRGLLCTGCNTGIGHLGDTEDRLFAAYEYLARANMRNT